ncbi:hypothetical protein L0Y34_01245 [Candidatus Parcubacteria bacterium]|nr:hypothetical protein [Candidatus Parcubacteria bacterium]
MYQEAAPRPKLLGTLQNGERVFDRPRSHLHENPALLKYLAHALIRIEPNNRPFIVEAVDFGQIIGESNCIETTPEDEIVFARRPRRAGLTRFVKNKERVPTSQLTAILLKTDEGYILISAFLGPKAEPEPWDKNATEASEKFWNTHAVVWGTEDIIPGTETSKVV